MTQLNSKPKSNGQLIWGLALVLAGVGVFIRIPQVMPKIAQIEVLAGTLGFVRACFYLMGIVLVGGGAQKIYRYVKKSNAGSKA